MTSTWTHKRLAEVCTLQRGFDLPTKDRKAGDNPLVSSSGIADFIDQSKVRGPGVVTGRSGSIGNVFFVEDDFWPLNTALYVKDFFGNDERFVFLLLQSLDLARFASGTGVPTLNRNHVSDEIVYVPESVDEQRRIVAVLDEAFAAIATATANAEKNLTNAQDLFTVALNKEMDSGAPIRSMKELCSFENGDRGENYAGRSAFVAEGVPIINAGHLDDGAIDAESMNFISRERYDLLRSGKTDRGDILFCLRGSLGKFAYNDIYDEGAIASSLIIIRPKSEILPDYFCHYLRSALCYQSIKHHENGAAQPNLGGKSLEKFMVPVPSLDEQRKIIARLDRIRAATQQLDEIYRRKLSALDRLKQSILHRAFTGELIATTRDLVPA